MPPLMLLSALVRSLLLILPRWHLVCIGWILYICTTWIGNDDAETIRTHGPPVFFLAGDSTTAAQNCCGGGWGNGFLSTLHNGALGSNFGRNGATTVSFVEDGEWADVLESVSRFSKSYTPYVTIAFGHNDLYVISLDEFTTNVQNLALDVQRAGGYPILVTPLSRRCYNASGLVEENLLDQRLAIISVAAGFTSGSAFLVDLNFASMTYLNRIGGGNALMYSLVPGDDTHLNGAGGLVFGNMLSGLVVQEVRNHRGYDIGGYTQPNETIWEAIVKGEFIFPTT